MKILMLTSYYNPHISGLTLHFERLANEYVKLGHKVTVVTSQHSKDLKKRDKINGVEVIRTPYLFKLNKGMFLHRILLDSYKAIKDCDVIHFNLPALEALPVAILGKILKKPIVSTYVCDITLPKFAGSRIFDYFIDIVHRITLNLSDEIVSFTDDFSQNSRILKNRKNVKEIYPIVEIESKKYLKIEKLDKSSHPRIGMATRIAADKGIDYMIEAFEMVLKKHPKATLLIAGTINAVGEEMYLNKLKPYFKKYSDKIILLGQLEPSQMPYFFKNIDLLVVASTNSTEAFGMVQVEAMFEGTPVVATDLPGVRVPVEITGMGKIAKIADSKDLANKIIDVIQDSKKINKTDVSKFFSTHKAVNNNLTIYKSLIKKNDPKSN